MSKKLIYKIIFFNQGKVYELYAKDIAQSALYGFIEVAGFIFGEKSAVVIDPSEERLKKEFNEVKRSYLPMHSVIRIDEVDKEGVAKIIPLDSKSSQIIGFPGAAYSPVDNKKDDS